MLYSSAASGLSVYRVQYDAFHSGRVGTIILPPQTEEHWRLGYLDNRRKALEVTAKRLGG